MKSTETPTCERFEAAISALIDGELESPEQLPAIDHLLECASCQDFYGRARALSSMVTFGAAGAEPAPAEVWERIAGETGLAGSGDARKPAPWWHRSRSLPGALGLAAGLILALGVWLLGPVVVDDSAPDARRESGVVEVMLEQDKGAMSDERFLALTLEILSADRGYHRKMLEVMRAVDGLATRPEGSGDETSLASRDGLQSFAIGEDGGENAALWSGDQL